MTLKRDPGPSAGGYTSTLWTTTVAGLAQHTWGKARTTVFDSPGFWSGNESVEVGLSRFQTDETQVVRISRVGGGAITSAVIYPRRLYDDRWEIQGSEIVLSMPPGGKCFVSINGTRKNRLYISSDPIDEGYDDLDPDTIIYDGTQVEAPAGKTLVFEAGLHNLVLFGAWADKLFPLRDGCTVVLALGAMVAGSFDLRKNGNTAVASDVTIRGGGNLSGEFETWETVSALTEFFDQLEYSMVMGFVDGVAPSGITIRGVGIWHSPFYVCETFTTLQDCAILSPWTPNTDAVRFGLGQNQTETLTVHRNLIWCDDDMMVLSYCYGDVSVTENVAGSVTSTNVQLGMQSLRADSGHTWTFRDNYFWLQQEHAEDEESEEEYGIGIQFWTDDPAGTSRERDYTITFDGTHFEGDLGNAMLFSIGPHLYPWGVDYDQFGRAGGVSFRNTTVETTPSIKSRLLSTDKNNTACGIEFNDLRIGGVPVSVRNAASFMTWPSAAFNIRIDGASLVT